MTLTELSLPTYVGPGDSCVTDAEESLFSRLRNAEPAAIGEVYDRHHRAVRAFAMRLTGDASIAEDLVHDVFVALPRAMARYRGEAALGTFLVSIAVNHARHHVRAAARRRAAMSRLEQEPRDSAPDPEHHARRRELAAALTVALDALPLDQRVAFVLCEVEELGAAAAAAIVGAPEATVRTRLFHARKKLRTHLERRGFP
jgi:RNA polymerase sigma-70 factor (ECF subfamily)